MVAVSLGLASAAWGQPQLRSATAWNPGTSSSECRSGTLNLGESDPSIEFGQYGTLFFESGIPTCRQAAHDTLLRKLRLVLAQPPHVDPLLNKVVSPFGSWLAGSNLALALPAAMRLGGAGFLDAPLDAALRAAIAAYEFNLDPTCGLNDSNGCIDDYTQAAVAYAWIAAYEQKSGRTSAAGQSAVQARNLIGRALSLDIHMCKVAGDDTLPSLCRGLPGIEEGLESGYHHLISFNHGFEDVAYGVGLITSISSAAIALEEAGSPYVAAPNEIMVARALFREGQRAALPDGSQFRTNCYRVSDRSLVRISECADAWNLRDRSDPLFNEWIYYLPRMFPVSTAYRRLFHGTPNADPFQFDRFDPSLFTGPFLNDGRRAVYGILGDAWWNDAGTSEVRPALDGYHGPRQRERAARH